MLCYAMLCHHPSTPNHAGHPLIASERLIDNLSNHIVLPISQYFLAIQSATLHDTRFY